MNEERLKILQMLSDGKITADEAAALLDASHETNPVVNATAGSVYADTDTQPETIHYTEPRYEQPQGNGLLGRWFNFANNLDGVRSGGANFQRSLFFANNLDSVDFRYADAENAKVFAANLDGANFEGANLRGARILCSNLDGANFRNANLEGVLIFGANFDGVNMEGVDLSGQSFVAVNMENYDATDAQAVMTSH